MHIYTFDTEKHDWELQSLNGPADFGLSQKNEILVGPSVDIVLATLLPFTDGQGRQRIAAIHHYARPWKLNGMEPFSLSVLQERDELSCAGQRIYISYEQPAQIVTFEPQEGEAAIFCPRCKDLVEGDAVKCPGCGLWYHESVTDERQCWSYDVRCVCGHSTSAGLSWKPQPVAPKRKWKARRRSRQ